MDEYFTALGIAIKNGLFVLLGMVIVATALTVASGASATLGWKKKPAGEGHGH